MAKQTKTISAGEFKTHCLRIMEEVRRSKKSVLVTKRGKPMVQLIPADDTTRPLFGCMKESLEILGDITEPTGEVWDADRDET